MSVTIKIKRRVSGNAGAPSSLYSGELAFNEIDSNLYFGFGDDGSGNATSIVVIGGSGSFMTLTGAQVVSGNKTFTGTNTLGAATSATTPATSDSSNLVATTAFVKAQNYQTGNANITVSGDASGSGTTAITLTLASVATAGTATKITYNAKGLVTSGTTLSATDIPSITSAKISDFSSAVTTFRLDQFSAPTSAVTFNGQLITNVAAPVNATDAANKQYVDQNIQGLSPKPSAKVATTGPLPAYTYNNGNSGVGATLTASANASLVIDGYTVAVNDIVLIKNETGSSAPYNGLYVCTNAGTSSAAYVLTRHIDMDQAGEFMGAFIPVEGFGATLMNTLWICNAASTVTPGTSAVPFSQLNGATQIVSGNGISYSGNVVSVVSANSGRILVSGSGVDLALAGTAGTYYKVTTDGYGRVTSGSNPTTLSGFGITDSQGLNANLTSLSGITGSANQVVYFTAANTLATASFTSYGQSLVAASSASAARTVLGLGTIATQNADNVNISGGQINSVIIDGGLF